MRRLAFYLMVINLLLAGCNQATAPEPAAPIPPARVLTAPMLSTQTPEAVRTTAGTQAAMPTRSPTAAPTLTPEPVNLPPGAEQAITAEIPELGHDGMADLHGVILFRSRELAPFSAFYKDGNFNSWPLTRSCHRSSDGYRCLWAISTDGQSVGLLSPEDFDFGWYLPQNGPPQVVEYGFVTNHPAIQPVRLPEICNRDPRRCDQIEFSPGGRFLGFRYGEDRCGRSMQLIDRKTGETVLKMDGGVQHIQFLPNGRLAITRGHCEGSRIDYFDPHTRQTVDGGGTGEESVWNPSRSILVTAESNYPGTRSNLWGYKMNTGRVFRPEGKNYRLYDEHVTFLPDGRRFLYQHLRIGTDKASGLDIFDTPAQIVRYDPISGQRTLLASDPRYHYRLCQFYHNGTCSEQWYGDWIQVQRVPFTTVRAEGYEWNLRSLMPCFADSSQCHTPPEAFALNASTGEIRPWDPASLPLAYPTPTPTPGPNTLDRPLYSDPAGQYALYVGADGDSLWMLPKEGPAVQWVENGEGFFYLP